MNQAGYGKNDQGKVAVDQIDIALPFHGKFLQKAGIVLQETLVNADIDLSSMVWKKPVDEFLLVQGRLYIKVNPVIIIGFSSGGLDKVLFIGTDEDDISFSAFIKGFFQMYISLSPYKIDQFKITDDSKGAAAVRVIVLMTGHIGKKTQSVVKVISIFLVYTAAAGQIIAFQMIHCIPPCIGKIITNTEENGKRCVAVLILMYYNIY